MHYFEGSFGFHSLRQQFTKSLAKPINNDLHIRLRTSVTQCAKRNRVVTGDDLPQDNNDISQQSSIVNGVDEIDLLVPEATRVKLKEEIASPFRKLRQFIYVGIGAAGGLGTFTAVPQLLFAFQDGGDALLPAITNVVVDVGGVIAAVFLWDRESSDEQKKIERFTEKEKMASNKISVAQQKDMETRLGQMPVEIQISENNENTTRIVSFSDLQLKGQQHIVVIAGTKSFIRDSVISARLEGIDFFNAQETIVIPVVLEDDQLDSNIAKGFGAKESLMKASYIAKPAQVFYISTSSCSCTIQPAPRPHLFSCSCSD